MTPLNFCSSILCMPERLVIFGGKHMLAQFKSQTKFLLATHFFTKQTAPKHATSVTLHQPTYNQTK